MASPAQPRPGESPAAFLRRVAAETVRRSGDAADRRGARRQTTEDAETLKRQEEAMALLRETRAARGLLPAASVARGGPPTPGPAVRPSAPVVPVHALYRPGSGRIRLVIGTVATGQVLIELLPETARALAVGIMDAVDQSRGHRGAETLPEPEPTEEPPWSDS